MIKRAEKRDIKIKKANARLYPLYKMFSWDLLFYYAISFLFLTQTKGFSVAEVMLADSFYPLFKVFVQLPVNYLVDKMGKKRALVLGNILLAFSIFQIIVCVNITSLIVVNLIMATAFIFKDLSASNLLYDSLNTKDGKGMYSTIEERGLSYYYYFDGITSMLTGFLFVKYNYLPMVICLLFALIGIIISMLFREVEIKEKKKKEKFIYSMGEYFKGLGLSFEYIFKSKRLKALLLYGMVFASLTYVFSTGKRGMLVEIGITPQYFAMIFSILTFIGGIGTKYIDHTKKVLGNKLLSVMGIVYVTSTILSCMLVAFKINTKIAIPLILTLYTIQYIIQAPYSAVMDKYLKSFAKPQTRTRIRVAYNILVCLTQTVACFIASYLLGYTKVGIAMCIITTTYLAIMVFVITFMKGKLGLKPDEYDKKDIETLKATIPESES